MTHQFSIRYGDNEETIVVIGVEEGGHTWYLWLSESEEPDASKLAEWVVSEAIPFVERTICKNRLDIEQREKHTIRNRKRKLRKKIKKREISLENVIKFYTVDEYNEKFNMGWIADQCNCIDEILTTFCLSHGYKIKAHESERLRKVNTYPVTAIKDFIARKENRELIQ